LIRLVRVIAAAEETFGSQEKAARWLRRPTTALEGDAPISLLDTGEGSRQVEHLLAMIDHGLAV
jgi:putative toxin-antitoxin system antitoxin component (TIGR02293 family)